ncbi:histidine kinase [Aquirufa nivalisilvae]|uniref:sensor histidine kinase n=1 Tax=Aquirufa nivalisilvae TaxID=2516557 RepID=UPI0022A92BFD|nr:histidine kinase [Aquirufa nivalisilvae]MCZ2478858.1 histidine kinase [Aquirufa nivalisilvae]MCZ2483592.1 histidine kinase [Aquirufa nivalisilvae]
MPNKIFRFKPILLHVIFWACFMALPYWMRPSPNSTDPQALQRYNSWTLFFIAFAFSNIPFFYLNTEILIPKILKKKGIVLYLILLSIAIPGMIWVYYELQEFIIISDHVKGRGGGGGFRRGPFMGTIFQLLFIIAIGVSYRFLSDNLKEKEIQKEEENERLKSELSFLRSQISPHFMFNVLNSIVSLSRRRPEMVESVVIKLSELMRYMIYETTDAKVAISKEMVYLENYIELQKIRFGNDIEITFNHKLADVPNSIEPMLLIPFVENAFKHGVGMVMNPIIEITLLDDREKLYFGVRNKVSSQISEKKDDSSGIGLTNVKRRLELLYPNEHHLKITEEGEYYHIELEIQHI